MADEIRPYRMKRRAEQQQRTRERIAASAAELHEKLGPSRTSISAVAERAGVRRSTVYRHFPDEESLFVACTSHWMASNMPPDLAAWAAIADPDERLRAALLELYGHYRRTQRMMENILRDEEAMPIVKQMFTGFRDYLEGARKTLMAGRGQRGRVRGRVSAAIGHALHFNTWDSLAREQGLDDSEAAELMCRLVAGAR
jgi:AcrR family transcriptional regulator